MVHGGRNYRETISCLSEPTGTCRLSFGLHRVKNLLHPGTIVVVCMYYNSNNVIVLGLGGFLHAFLFVHSFLGVADDGLRGIRLFPSTHSYLGVVVVDGSYDVVIGNIIHTNSDFTVIIETILTTRISTRPIVFVKNL